MNALTQRSTRMPQATSLSQLRACVRSLAVSSMRKAGAVAASLRQSVMGYPSLAAAASHSSFIGFGLRTTNTQGGNKPWTQANRVQIHRGKYV